jgi:ParB family transcriptional regulator, chromosome partitioning protein
MARGGQGSVLRSILGPAREAAEARSLNARSVPLENIVPAEGQPRRGFDKQAMRDLAASVKEHGVIQPLLVRPHLGESELYEIVAGERRYRAAREVGLERIPVVVRELSNEEAAALALVEHLQREDLNPVEETEGILKLLALALGDVCTEEVVSLLYRMDREARGQAAHNVMGGPRAIIVQETFERLGRMGWRSFVTNRLSLIKLPDDVLSAVREGQLAYTKAVLLARVEDGEDRGKLLAQALEGNTSISELRRRVKMLLSGEPSENLRTTVREDLGKRAAKLAKTVRRSQALRDEKKARELELLFTRIEELLSG